MTGSTRVGRRRAESTSPGRTTITDPTTTSAAPVSSTQLIPASPSSARALGHSRTTCASRLLDATRSTTCTCDARRAIGVLGLKFIVHLGEFMVDRDEDGRVDLTRPEVTLAHRFLKNTVIESDGPKAYAFMSAKCFPQRLHQLKLPVVAGRRLTSPLRWCWPSSRFNDTSPRGTHDDHAANCRVCSLPISGLRWRRFQDMVG